MSDNILEQAQVNRLVVPGKTICRELRASVLEHQGTIIDVTNVGTIKTLYQNVQVIEPTAEDLTLYLEKPNDPTLFAVKCAIGNYVSLVLPTLEVDESCTLGVVFLPEAPGISLFVSAPDENEDPVFLVGPRNFLYSYEYNTVVNFFLVNQEPGQLLVLYGVRKGNQTLWYWLENSFGWFID